MLLNNRLPVDRAQSQSHTAVKAYCPPIGFISVIVRHSPPYPIWAQPRSSQVKLRVRKPHTKSNFGFRRTIAINSLTEEV
jgi:hypothetical protein